MLRLVLAAILAGLVFQLLPVMLGMLALAEFFMTEDGQASHISHVSKRSG
jgi:hypothetical protein